MHRRSTEHPSVTGVTLHLRIWSAEEPARTSGREPEPTGAAERAPEATPGQGAVVLAHGLGEHVGRYEHVAAHLVSRGHRVYGLDHAGFGRSGGRRGDTSVHRAARDLVSLGRRIDEELGPGAPRTLVGHSMGGLIALVALRDHPGRFSRAVVIGPALNVARGIHPVLLGLSRLLGATLSGVTLANGLDPSALCSDPRVGRDYEADPLVHDRISARLYNSMREEGQRLRQVPDCFPPDTAVLLMHGRDDSICYADDTEAYFAALPLERKTLKVWPGMRHELLNEPEHAEVLDEIDRFLERT